jgi:hypothetical protein
MDGNGFYGLIITQKKIKPLSVSEQRKAAPQGGFCSLGDTTDANKARL